MDSNLISYLLIKCYMDGRRDGGILCKKKEAVEYIKELTSKMVTEVNTGDAASECRICAYSSIVPGSSHHIECSNPNLLMEGDDHGIKNGWFQYPYNFDPCWKLVPCANFKEKVVKHYGK